jgi:hypothetical protein
MSMEFVITLIVYAAATLIVYAAAVSIIATAVFCGIILAGAVWTAWSPMKGK